MLSVCIPVLNEATHLPRLLTALSAQRGLTLDVIVADGGSVDGSVDDLTGDVRVVRARRGRASQMNAAARAARSKLLLFLHADSGLGGSAQLEDAVACLCNAIQAGGHDRMAGHFALRFERNTRQNPILFRYMEAKSALNRRGTINGDQGLLVTRRFFESLGGFDERAAFFEDQLLAERVFAAGRWITLPGRLTTSARRFETLGGWRVYLFMALIMSARRVGNEVFFRQVPALYERQSEDSRLDARAVLSAWWQSWRVQTWKRRLRWAGAICAYAGRNIWQVPLFLKVVMQGTGD